MLIVMVTFGGLNVKSLGEKFISMVYDGRILRCKRWCDAQMTNNVVPFMIVVHCFAHRTNLVVFILFKLSLVAHLEALFRPCMGFFFHSSKKFLEFQRLCDKLIEKGNKVLRNMKTRWINMLSFVKCVMEQSTFDCKNA